MPHRAALPAGVLWDMDGTLLDSEPYWIAEEQDLVREAGGVWTEQDGHDLVGNDLITSAQIILDRTPVTMTPEAVVERLLAGVIARTRERMPWRPGARELLADCVAAGVPCALVTMSWSVFADLLLEALPERTFAAVVTGDQVRHGKPHPEPYLTACDLLGAAPADCVAIEDSPTGAASSVAAGVPTIVVPHVVAVPQRAGAVQVPTLEGLAPADLWRIARGH